MPSGATLLNPSFSNILGVPNQRSLGTAAIFFDLGTALRQLGVARDPNTTSGKIATVLNHPVTIGRALLRKLRRGR